MTDMKGTDKTFQYTYTVHVTHLMSNRSGADEEKLQCFGFNKSAHFATLLRHHLKQN
jgi:hypothetical protein